jgi:hypothetical protein
MCASVCICMGLRRQYIKAAEDTHTFPISHPLLWVHSFGKANTKCSETVPVQELTNTREVQPLKPELGNKNLLGMLPKLALDLTFLAHSGNGLGDLLLEHNYLSWYKPKVSEHCYGSELKGLWPG